MELLDDLKALQMLQGFFIASSIWLALGHENIVRESSPENLADEQDLSNTTTNTYYLILASL